MIPVTGWNKLGDKTEDPIQFPHDLDETPLQLKTNTPFQSGGTPRIVKLELFHEFNGPVGNIKIEFSDPPEYLLDLCMVSDAEFDLGNNECSNDEKMWEISMSRDPNPNILIKCDQTILLDTALASICAQSSGSYWTYSARMIKFYSDTAPDFWRAKKGSRQHKEDSSKIWISGNEIFDTIQYAN